VKLAILFIFVCIFASSICMAQVPAAKTTNGIATSQITVKIPSFAIIDLPGNSTKVAAPKYASEIKNTSEMTGTTQNIRANNKWSVNMYSEREVFSATQEKQSNKAQNPSLTLIFVATQI
jgi:hypothetical protein